MLLEQSIEQRDIFPLELSASPSQRWTEMPKGGHFAAWEEPERLAHDMREFFRPFSEDDSLFRGLSFSPIISGRLTSNTDDGLPSLRCTIRTSWGVGLWPRAQNCSVR